MNVVGIDPGGKSTGIVVRWGAILLWHAVIQNRDKALGMPNRQYLDSVRFALLRVEDFGPDTWLMEDVTPPRGFKNGRRDAIQPGSLIGVSAVAGFILAHRPSTILVPAAGNGSRPLTTYPPALVGPREKTGGGILRHARSAWDIAGHAARSTR